MKISIIIPARNEERFIQKLIGYLNGLETGGFSKEIIVVDGMSTDRTVHLAKDAGAIVLQPKLKGRSTQLNLGAETATGDIYYFLHADTFPPASLFYDLQEAIQANFEAGCYQLSFDSSHWFLKLNAWFSRFNLNAFRYGDQSLFVTKMAFEHIAGYDREMKILEDNEVITRLKKYVRFKLINKVVVTSSRKYMEHGVFRLQFSYYLIYMLYKLGGSQHFLLKIYRFLLGKPWTLLPVVAYCFDHCIGTG